MINQTFEEIYDADIAFGAIINDEYVGFPKDYLILHCLLRMYKPESVFEIGTNMGTGTEIICNAVPDAQVFSLDLPTELAHISLQHPVSEGKGDKVGSKCKFAYAQLRGDSMKFDFRKWPCEAYFIDGEHDYQHVLHETCEIVNLLPNLIIYHDADIEEVYQAIVAAMDGKPYDLYRVVDTRIAYCVKKEK